MKFYCDECGKKISQPFDPRRYIRGLVKIIIMIVLLILYLPVLPFVLLFDFVRWVYESDKYMLVIIKKLVNGEDLRWSESDLAFTFFYVGSIIAVLSWLFGLVYLGVIHLE